jgi:hypothetical protein
MLGSLSVRDSFSTITGSYGPLKKFNNPEVSVGLFGILSWIRNTGSDPPIGNLSFAGECHHNEEA